MKTARYRVEPGKKVDLTKWTTHEARQFDGGKTAGKEELGLLNVRLAELQELLYGAGKHKLLIVLQGMDTSGKDGSIKHVFRSVNPAGVHVASFKKPSERELEHDFLWRIHERTPESGHITIFNRSHYEDVLIVRVHDLVPEKVWSRRYAHIRAFEKLLADEGTTIIKFFLHISKDEQKQRLEARIEDQTKNWKFMVADVEEREYWDDYQRAYEEAISETATADAPWYIVPADRKWYRNLVISNTLIDALQRLDMRYPPAPEGLDKIVIP